MVSRKKLRSSRKALCVFSLAVTLMLLLAASVYANTLTAGTFMQDGITYQIKSSDSCTVVVRSGSTSPAVDLSITGVDVSIPGEVTYEGVSYTVVEIGDYAFNGLNTLEKVNLPSSIVGIGNYAFAGCATMDDSTSTPTYSGLTTLTLPSDTKLATIGGHCFSKDYALESFIIPKTVVSIGTYAFSDCFTFDKLSFEQGSSISDISDFCFSMDWQDGWTKPKEWLEHPDYTYQSVDWANCKTIQDDVASSKDYGGLKSIDLPKSVQTVGDSAFANQRDLKSIVFEASDISKIGDWSFAFCTSLTKVSVPGAGAIQDVSVGYQYAYAQYAFCGCTNLTDFTFSGEIKASAGRWSELRMFDGDTKLSNVVYCVNKVLPATTWYFLGEKYDVGFNSSNPRLYYRVMFYDSENAATAGTDPLGTAILRDGTTLSSIKADMATSDSKGAIVYSGTVPSLPSGYDAWKFQAGNAASPLETPVYAYPVSSTDLTCASVVLSNDAFWYTGKPQQPAATVVNAAGTTLAADTDYVLSYERETDGVWSETTDLSSVGTIRVTATAANGSSYIGSTSSTYEIAYLSAGAEITTDGITYEVIKDQSATTPAEVQVGNGTASAVTTTTSGTVVIPSSIELAGSDYPVLVTKIGDNAFGSSDASSVCASVTGVVLPEGITSIGNYSFGNMPLLSSIELPSTLDAIGTGAFAYDTALSDVAFDGSTMESIGVSAFAYCSSLRTLRLPAVTGQIQGLAFSNCTMLNTLTFLGDVNMTSANQFSDCKRLSTVVYHGKSLDYAFSSNPRIYYQVTFYAVGGKTRLGSASVLGGTEFTKIGSSLSKSLIVDGSIPSLPSKTGYWDFKESGSKLVASCEAIAARGARVGTVCDAGSKTTRALYKVSSNGKATVTYWSCKSTARSSAAIPAKVTIKGKTYVVVCVNRKAFAKKRSVKVVTVKSKTITSFKKAFENSKVTTVKVPAAKKRTYRKLLTSKACGKKVSVR